ARRRHPAPQVRDSEEAARVIEWRTRPRGRPLRIDHAALERRPPNPTRIVVRGPDPEPAILRLGLDLHRLPGEELRHLLRVVPRLRPDGRHLAGSVHRAIVVEIDRVFA